jgi:hypothetical protein
MSNADRHGQGVRGQDVSPADRPLCAGNRAAVGRLALLGLACGLFLAMLAAGCQTAPQTHPRRQGGAGDPCAERLHLICGQLLLYCLQRDELPAALADLKGTGPGELPPLLCPTSGKPYVYNREGLSVPGKAGRLVVYDADACHSGMRWGILADVAWGEKGLNARVISLPDGPMFSGGKK